MAAHPPRAAGTDADPNPKPQKRARCTGKMADGLPTDFYESTGSSSSSSSEEQDDTTDDGIPESLLSEFSEEEDEETRAPGVEGEAIPPPATDDEDDRVDKIWKAAAKGDLALAQDLSFPGADLTSFSKREFDEDVPDEVRNEILVWLFEEEAAEPWDSFELHDEALIEATKAACIDPFQGYEGPWCPLHESVRMLSGDDDMLQDMRVVVQHLDYFLDAIGIDDVGDKESLSGLRGFATLNGYFKTASYLQEEGVSRGRPGIDWTRPPGYVALSNAHYEVTGQRYGPPELLVVTESEDKSSRWINEANATVTGDGYTVNGAGCTVNGDNNVVNGSFCSVTGRHNTVNGHSCSVKGADNIVTGKDCAVVETESSAGLAESAAAAKEEAETVDFPVFKNRKIVRIAARTALIRGINTSIFVEDRDGSTLVEETRVPRGTQLNPVRGIGTVVRFASKDAAKTFWRENGFGEVETKLITAMKFDEECVDGDDESKECALCCANKRSIALVPCGHANACAKCVLQLVESSEQLACPWCKTPADDVMWIRF